jgi:hypothetical protein
MIFFSGSEKRFGRRDGQATPDPWTALEAAFRKLGPNARVTVLPGASGTLFPPEIELAKLMET